MCFPHPVFEGALIHGFYYHLLMLPGYHLLSIKIPLNLLVSIAERQGGPDLDVCFGLVNQETFQNGVRTMQSSVKGPLLIVYRTALNNIDEH